VELTFASNFIVEATGVLQNKEEVLPDSLRKRLDINNFIDKLLGSKPSVIIPYDSTARKTWKYHAENVHNFAFTADPTYRIGETYWEDVQCIALVQEQNAANWMPVADYTAKVVELFSKDFGRYAYPKMIVADARDGMEYPMLTLCGGLYPGNKGLIAHEVGHNWFYGIIGSNETYRAMMDEGFTQFITVWALENIPPDSSEIVTEKKWNTLPQLPSRDTRGYLGYLVDAVRYEDMPLNTHSDMFNGAIRQGGGYRHVYSKTATMLYNLQYVLGDTLFQNAMKHYFNQWKMAHPYPEDFRNSITQYTKVDLNWFFDQWMETTKTIDYKVSRVRHKTKDLRQETNGSGQNGINAEKSNIANRTSQIVFKRKGEMQMPIDFSVVLKNNDTLHYHIPNTWFDKTQTLPLSKGELEGVTVLPRWIGWQKLKPTYTATIQTSEKIKDVIIDPSNRLADIDMTDNSKRSQTQWHWDKRIRQPLDWRKYHVYTRPELWWNAIDGFRVGWHLNGNYMQYKHKISMSVWFPTTLAQGNPARYNYGFNEYNTVTDVVNYRIDYETGLNKIIKGLSVFYTSGYVEGLEFYRTGFTQKIRNSSISAYMKLMTRPKVNADFYVVNGLWLTERLNNSVNVEWNHKYNYDLGTGKLNMTLRSNSIASDYDFSFVEATKINYTKLWKLELRTRFFARYGFGNNIPYESALSYTRANNEELMDYALLRSKGFVPPASVQNQAMFSFQQGGGLNLRGYAGMQTLSFQSNGVGYALASGGAAINAEIDLDGLIKLQPKNFKNWLHIDFYLFADAGIGRNQGVNALAAAPELPFVPNFEETLLADAGAGIVFNIKRWGKNSTIKPFSIRFDMPFWVSNGAIIRQNNFANRWVFGLYRSF
jgi:aminopeptidase N